jgi:hypothetical protein
MRSSVTEMLISESHSMSSFGSENRIPPFPSRPPRSSFPLKILRHEQLLVQPPSFERFGSDSKALNRLHAGSILENHPLKFPGCFLSFPAPQLQSADQISPSVILFLQIRNRVVGNFCATESFFPSRRSGELSRAWALLYHCEYYPHSHPRQAGRDVETPSVSRTNSHPFSFHFSNGNVDSLL